MVADQPQQYKLGKTSIVELTRGDITRFDGDAIVNAANERMLGGGGVDGAIHRAAGRDLYYACREVEEVEPGVRCPTGEARITPGFYLPAKHVIHTVGPVYDDADTSAPLLEAAHRNCMQLANEHGLKSIAFPAISCGIFGYPLKDAASIALQTVKDEAGSVERVYFFLHDPRAWTAFTEIAAATLDPCEDDAPEEVAHASEAAPNTDEAVSVGGGADAPTSDEATGAAVAAGSPISAGNTREAATADANDVDPIPTQQAGPKVDDAEPVSPQPSVMSAATKQAGPDVDDAQPVATQPSDTSSASQQAGPDVHDARPGSAQLSVVSAATHQAGHIDSQQEDAPTSAASAP